MSKGPNVTPRRGKNIRGKETSTNMPTQRSGMKLKGPAEGPAKWPARGTRKRACTINKERRTQWKQPRSRCRSAIRAVEGKCEGMEQGNLERRENEATSNARKQSNLERKPRTQPRMQAPERNLEHKPRTQPQLHTKKPTTHTPNPHSIRPLCHHEGKEQ